MIVHRSSRRRRSVAIHYIGLTRRIVSPERTGVANTQLGLVLTFVAGATNAGGFLAIGQYTSHMSGRGCHVNLKKSAPGPASPISGKHASRGSPFRHGPQAVNVDGKRSAVGSGRNEQVPDSGKDGGEPLQASHRPEALHYPLPLSQRNM